MKQAKAPESAPKAAPTEAEMDAAATVIQAAALAAEAQLAAAPSPAATAAADAAAADAAVKYEPIAATQTERIAALYKALDVDGSGFLVSHIRGNTVHHELLRFNF